MSALRVNVGGAPVYVDPYTRQPFDPATLDLPSVPVFPVVTVQAPRSRCSHARVADDVVIGALRATHGNAYRAAQLAGLTKQAIKQRITTLDRLGLLPEDVYRMIEARRREP